MDFVILVLIVSSGLFTGTILTIAWDRLPAWKKMSPGTFKTDFAQTIRVADTMQPLLITVAITAALIFGLQADGISRILAFTATVGYVTILLISLAILVPLQRQLLTQYEPSESLRKWSKGHLGRTVVAIISFILSSAAIALGY